MSRSKLLSLPALRRCLGRARQAGQRIVFTNGVFDLLHPGHVRYLHAARRLGDVLVVGLNSDRSTRRLGKGAGRPLVPQRDRAEVLSALAMVDYVVIFDADTPFELIRAVQPDVLVKGGDWAVDRIVGADVVRARRGRVVSLPFARGYSTTALVERMRRVPAGPAAARRRRASGRAAVERAVPADGQTAARTRSRRGARSRRRE